MKKLDKKGFTLAELLIVVAIIAILVAIGIPVFNATLEKSRETADVANLRAAKAAGTVLLLDSVDVDGEALDVAGTTTFPYYCYYDTATGELKGTVATTATNTGTASTSAAGPCGKGTALAGNKPDADVLFTDGTNEYVPTLNVGSQYLMVTINPGNTTSPVQVGFVTAAKGTYTAAP